jgi:protein O-mannosyl-transferase
MTTASKEKRVKDRTLLLAMTGLLALVFVVFSPTIRSEFLRYDDEIYIFYNPQLRSLSADNVLWIFTHGYYKSYIPLTMLSHSVDYAVWGLNARGHHLTNVVLHACTAGWLFLAALLLFRRMGPGKEDTTVLYAASLGAALLFALHPLRVESVAWVSDRKDLLLGFFLFASFVFFLREREHAGTNRRRWDRRLSLLFFVLAALSKTTAIVAPLVFVLVDLLLLSPSASRSALVPSLRRQAPYLVVSAVVGIAAVASTEGAQLHYALRAMGPVELGLLPLYSTGFYVIMMLLPFGLTPVYAPPGALMMFTAIAVPLVLSTFAVVMLLRSRPAPFVAWGSYLLLLLPTLAGLPAGIQPWADRYSYVPLTPLFLLGAGAGVPALVRWWKGGRRLALPAVALVVIGGLTFLTVVQSAFWKDSVTLWRRAVQTAPEAGALTLVPLGVAHFHAGAIDSALTFYQRAAAVDPSYVETYFSMGEAYAAKGELGSAAEAYQEALRRDSTNFGSRNNLADIYLKAGRVDESVAMYERLLRGRPGNARVHNNLAFALERRGDLPRAIEHYREAIDLDRRFLHPYVNLGALYRNAGQPENALAVLEQALPIADGDSKLNYNIARAYEALQRTAEAEAAYRRALVAEPRFVDGWVGLGGLIARAGRVDEARDLYEHLVAAIPDSPDLRVNLGGLYLAAGAYERASAEFQEAIKLKSDFAPAYYSLGLLHRARGDSAAARQSFQIAARFGSEPAQAVLGGSAAKP